MMPTRGERGFTLTEILIAVAIIGVLTAIAVPLLITQNQKADRASLQEDLSNSARMLFAAYAEGAPLPAGVPAGKPRTFDGIGTLSVTHDVTVHGTNRTTMCVQGVTNFGEIWSYRLDGGLAQVPCTEAIPDMSLNYPRVTLDAGTTRDTVVPVLDNPIGDVLYDIEGELPPGVRFDPITGGFTGPTPGEMPWQGTDITAGGDHTCATGADGTVRCWGSNDYAELGDGTRIDELTPVIADVVVDDTVVIAGGEDFTCVVNAEGTISCWGANGSGQLGTGDTSTLEEVPQEVDTTGHAEQVAAGKKHVCAVSHAHNLQCWGKNANGEVGGGRTDDVVNFPVPVLENLDIKQVAAGYSHTCALDLDGDVYCWGKNDHGQIGKNPDVNKYIDPVKVNTISNIAWIAAGGNSTCAVRNNGDLYCWGENYLGQAGDASTDDVVRPEIVNGLPAVTKASVSATHGCALTTTGDVWCWGSGEVIGGPGFLHEDPSLVSGVSDAFDITSGTDHACVLVGTKGEALCWGVNEEGVVGDGTTIDRYSPTPVTGSGHTDADTSKTVTVTATDETGRTCSKTSTVHTRK